ncbi:MAG: hypothetical protein I3274_02615 [Candidatus Moeniiplasma glomeromycotorum]|nr:hypothetical protein [Candidatus Moeniiplasma glomeromycotorum]MCE8167497.1 hypothetical protein [Candidatus Moeniiplasma glomeromycotorum]
MNDSQRSNEVSDRKKCCEWRKLLVNSLSQNDKETGLECFYNWCRYGMNLTEIYSAEQKKFDCTLCQKMFNELSRASGYDFNLSQEQALNSLKQMANSEVVKCCLVVKFLNPRDPDKDYRRRQAIFYQEAFQDKMCSECSRKCKLVLLWAE